MDIPDIRSLLPHAGPMVLLDRVISVDDDSLLAEVRIRSDSLFCDGDGVGAWVGIEYMAQAIGAWAGYIARLRGEPVKLGIFAWHQALRMQSPDFFVRQCTPGSCPTCIPGRKWVGFV